VATVKVLAIANMYPPHHLGGYELSCQDTLERFRANGHDVRVLTTTMRRADVDERAHPDDPVVRRELEMYWRDYEITKPPLRERLRIERHNQRVLEATLDADPPDVVSFWNMGAMSLGIVTTVLEREIPAVLVVCDDWLVYGPLVDPWARLFRRAPWFGRVVRRAVGVPTTVPDLGAVDAVCFVSESVRGAAAQATPWTFRRSTVTFSGIDRADFPPLRPDEAAGEWRGRLCYVGRLDPRKGVETVVRAFARLSADYALDIVGPGERSYVDEVRRLTESLGVAPRVTFREAPRPAVRSCYLAADVVLFPSEWPEPFGLVPLEAMACGRPVVASGTGGSGEYLEDERNCLLFAPGDPESLAAAIARVGADAALRAQLVEQGLRTADGFDTDRLASVLEEWHVAAARRFADGVPADRPPPALRAR
jgi:glycosyltransferase involved in cell wall biosynthesis